MRRDARACLALAPLALLVALAASAALLLGQAPDRLVLERAWAPPSRDALLGAGDGGVDVAALAAHAVLRVLGLSLGVAAWGFAVGTVAGTVAGLGGRLAERAVLGACDLLQAFPTFLLALAVLSAVREPSRWHLAGVFALTAWAPFARLATVQARALRGAGFVEAARALGVPPLTLLRVHVVPLVVGPCAVQAGSAAAGVVLGETALGFVGLGPADGVSLGGLLEQGVVSMLRAPHVLATGAVTVVALSGSLQLASEGLRRLWTRT